MRKRSWTMFVALCLCCFLILPASPALGANNFSDIKGHWANSYIVSLASQGYMQGYPDGSFKPDRTMTKAEFTTAVITCLGENPPTPSVNSFDDTKNHWARKYIEEAVRRGILVPSESPQGLDPDNAIMRSQAAAMLVRALNISPAEGTLKFTDRDQVERSLYRNHIKAASDAGLISGFPDGSFDPFRAMTRAQVCTVLTKMLDKLGTSRPSLPPPVTHPVTGSIATIAVGEDLFPLGTTAVSFKSGFSEIPFMSLSVAYDALTVNGKYVYALNRSTGNPDVVINNTRYSIGKMVVNGDKLVVFPTSRHINTFELDNRRYNSDYVKLYVKASDEGRYLSDLEVIDETRVKVKGETYDLDRDKITIEVNQDFYDLTRIQLSPGNTVARLKETDPVIYRGMSLSDIAAIFIDTDTLDVDRIDTIYFVIDGERYRLSEVSMDASTNITVGGETYDADEVVMIIDNVNYQIDYVKYLKDKFVFYCQEGDSLDWVMFNKTYRDYRDVKILKGSSVYDMESVLVVDRNLVRIGSRQYEVDDDNIQCRVDNKVWNIERIDWDDRLDMIVITADEDRDSTWGNQPEDYMFYDEDDRRIYRGADDEVQLYIDRKWLTFDDVLIPDPSSCTYKGESYDLIGTRIRIEGDDYRIIETSWSSSGTLRIYLEEY